MTTSLPLVVGSSGPVPQSPAAVQEALIELVSSTNPGYTADLPGSLIEDLSSTSVAAILLCDQAQVELVNSLTPLGANPFLLNQLGQIYGVQLGEATNTSVDVVFSGPPGFVIAQGFTVGDGTNQYTVSDGGIIGAGGTSAPLFCLCSTSGSFAVPAGTVVNLITSVPTGISLSVNNPTPGTQGQGAETEASYRARVLQAGLAISTGMATFLKTILNNVPGVQPRLVSVRQVPNNGGWEIIVGGGDPFEVAYAIYTALFDISTLVGSTINVLAVTKANPGVATTDLNHGLTDGQTGVNIAGALPSGYNVSNATVHVIDEKTFSYGVNTTALATYTGGGVVTPNNRNQVVTIQDYPDTYSIPFVLPPQQAVAMTVLWGTTSTNVISEAGISQLAGPALLAYINGLPAGQPINVDVMVSTFSAAVAPILDPQLLSRLVFEVSINGVGVSPATGTVIISGDPEGYFLADISDIDISEG